MMDGDYDVEANIKRLWRRAKCCNCLYYEFWIDVFVY